MGKGRRHLLAVAFLAFPLLAYGCGSDDHPNEPRPPAPIEVSASIDDKRVTVAPNRFSAGLVNLTISNQSDVPVSLNVEGPVTDASNPIAPNSVGNFKLDFLEGEYTVTAGEESDAKETTVTVGPERPSSQNQLLLP